MSALTFEELLIERGVVDAAGLERAKRSLEDSGQPLSLVLLNLGLVSSQQVVECLAESSGLPVMAREDFPEAPVELPELQPIFLRHHKVLPIAANETTLDLAMADPLDPYARQAIGYATGRDVRAFVADLRDIEEVIEAFYFEKARLNGIASPISEIWQAAGEDPDADRLKELASDAPVIKYVNRIIARAIEAGASDIHFEPLESAFRVRYRVDGVLREVDHPAKSMQAAVVSRIKILANLNIAERRLAQDGRFKATIEGREMDFRVSTMPTAFGEGVVLRLLQRGQKPHSFEALGFSEATVDRLRGALEKPDGIILVTGPTGSGKTTTLYSALGILNQPERKILTVEDPIEYVLDGVNQVQVDAKIGRTFAKTLRSFLRQDPDVMMVGEIRDHETAEIAIQAALTGHLVLSTLHTNSAAAALPRLLDMGIDDYLIASTVRVIIGQRLVRVLCANCRRETQPDAALAKRIWRSSKRSPGRAPIFAPGGCGTCRESGYLGRTVIAEALAVSDAIRSLIQKSGPSSDIERAAVREGMETMFENGLGAVKEGRTSIEEVLRVTAEI